MREGTTVSFDYKTPKPRTIGILILAFVILIVLWGTNTPVESNKNE